MKQKRDYVKILVLLALSLVVQNSAASDASWWSRWMPSKEAITGIACAAPYAIGAQRLLAQRAQKAQLPAYSYFIPAALGTAVGTFARSDQGWRQALLQSLWHNAPALAVAAMLWSGDYLWSAALKNVQQNKEAEEQLRLMFKTYNLELSRLIDDFRNVLKKSNILENEILILPEFTQLKDQYNIVVGLYNNLVTNKEHYTNNDHLNSVIMLTPAEILYSEYLAYVYIYSLKQSTEKSWEQLSQEERKGVVINLSRFYTSTFIDQLKKDEFEIPDTTKNFLLNFYNLLANTQIDDRKAIVLMTEIIGIIKAYAAEPASQQSNERMKELWEQSKVFENRIIPPVRLTGTSQEKESVIENEKKRLHELMKEYQQRINYFVEKLFSTEQDTLVDAQYKNLLILRSLLQESFTWLRSQGINDLSEMSLKPYDYIYAAVNARVIKPHVKFILQENAKPSLDFIFSKMQDQNINKKVLEVISKSKVLESDINAANDKEDKDRNIRLINKVIKLINEAKKSEDDLLESVLHDALVDQ